MRALLLLLFGVMIPGCGAMSGLEEFASSDASVPTDARDAARDAQPEATPDADVQRCGGDMGAECGPDEFCQYDSRDLCGGADSPGICAPRPHVCEDDCPGVCGCDGQTYCNACDARRNGVDVGPPVCR